MTELTLEALAARIDAIEKKLGEQQVVPSRKKDWRSVVGILDDRESARQMIAETLAIRETEREAARDGQAE